MIIKITQEHIDNASHKILSRNCPIALALKDMNYDDFWVNPRTIILNGIIYGLDKNVQDFIRNFDYNLCKVEPFEFEL